jgi:hypothetical protein
MGEQIFKATIIAAAGFFAALFAYGSVRGRIRQLIPRLDYLPVCDRHRAAFDIKSNAIQILPGMTVLAHRESE